MNRPPQISIVIPVYRSQRILAVLVDAIADAMHSAGYAGRFELILVNDASPDDSWTIIEGLARHKPFVRGISLRKNTGQHNAIMAGLNHVRGNTVVLMDDDLQHPPAEIPALIDMINAGYDVCYTRYIGRQHPWWKQLGSRFNDRVATVLLKKPAGLYLSSFKALRRDIADQIVKYDGPFTYVDGLILNTTRSIGVRDITHQSRYEGESTYSFSKLLSLWLKMATSFSVLPLRLATYLGFALTGLSLLMLIYIIFAKLFQPELPQGWASLIAAILLTGGVQTFCIGVVGEYLGRAYLRLNQHPQYVVGETTADWSEQDARAGIR